MLTFEEGGKMNTLDFCEKYLTNYTIKSDGTIDIDGKVDLFNKLGNMEKLPVKFGKVYGVFRCHGNKLTTLEGCPNYVGGFFNCGGNKLTTLEGCPKYVDGIFMCHWCGLTTLKGIEKCEILGDFHCSHNDIPPENYIYILTAKIDGRIHTGNDDIDNILNTYKNEVKYLHKALSELKKVII
jgi:hypothetical protein